AEALNQKYKDKGLVVFAAHGHAGIEGAADNAKTLGVTFPFAEDKDGKFRAAMKGDQDPNVYFIDRSGALRYAQLDATSMEDAADPLVKETAEHPAAVPTSLGRKTAEPDR